MLRLRTSLAARCAASCSVPCGRGYRPPNAVSTGSWSVDIARTRMCVADWQSLKRNLPILVPCAIIVMPATLEKGWRWGDHWARTRVIWKKHRLELPFAPQGILCLVCGYDLTGNVSGVCPECGTRIRRPSQQGTSG